MAEFLSANDLAYLAIIICLFVALHTECQDAIPTGSTGKLYSIFLSSYMLSILDLMK